MTDKIRLSAVQAASAFFDKQAALEIALHWIDKAAKDKPDVIALGDLSTVLWARHGGKQQLNYWPMAFFWMGRKSLRSAKRLSG